MKELRAKDFYDLGLHTQNTRTHFDDQDEETGERSEFIVTNVRNLMSNMELACEWIDAPETQAFLKRKKDAPPTTIEAYDEICEAFQAALEIKSVLILDRAKLSFYKAKNLFGMNVDKAFPSASPEIRDGATCYAVGQPTAAVFHFMRAIEVGLVALAKEFGITKFSDWNSSLEDTEKAVRDRTNPSTRPNWADEKDDFTAMIPFLYTVKNAWRNYTMHTKARYNEEETLEIMNATKSFMQRAAKRLKE